jgi:ABC-type branched-subunit amino acid transport system permease subunit
MPPSVVIATGYVGQLSLAQYAVAGLGALVASRAASDLGLPFLVGLVVGIGAGIVAGT